MLGITSVTFRNKSIEEIFKFCKLNKVECIEWGSDIHAKVEDVENAKKIKALSSLYNIKNCSYGSYFRIGNGDDIKKYVEIAKILDTDVIRIWAANISSKLVSRELLRSYIDEAKEIANICEKENITLAFEYHRNTLTDTKEGALNLIKAINRDNVKLYWQPNPELEIKEQIEEIRLLRSYIINVHFFYWDKANRRYPLEKGKEHWKVYINELKNKNLNYLLEFCLDDSFDRGAKDLKTMSSLLKN